MHLFDMPSHVALKTKCAFAAIDRTLKQLPLVEQEMPRQVILSTVAGLTVIYMTHEWPLFMQNINKKAF